MKLFSVSFETREKYLLKNVDFLKGVYVKIFHPNRIPWNMTKEDLKKYTGNSLGAKLLGFLTANNLSLQPMYESHDIYHVVSGYGIGMVNEAKLFFFLLGNGKRSVSVLGSILVAIFFYPEKWSEFSIAFKNGKEFNSLKNIDFELLLGDDYDNMIKFLRK